jgi:hypothetical protein
MCHIFSTKKFGLEENEKLVRVRRNREREREREIVYNIKYEDKFNVVINKKIKKSDELCICNKLRNTTSTRKKSNKTRAKKFQFKLFLTNLLNYCDFF